MNYIKWHEDLHASQPGYKEMPLIACSGDTGGGAGQDDAPGEGVEAACHWPPALKALSKQV